MSWFGPKTDAEQKAEDHRRRGFDGPIDENGDAHMARRSERSFDWLGTNTPDDKNGRCPGSLARRSRSR